MQVLQIFFGIILVMVIIGLAIEAVKNPLLAIRWVLAVIGGVFLLLIMYVPLSFPQLGMSEYSGVSIVYVFSFLIILGKTYKDIKEENNEGNIFLRLVVAAIMSLSFSLLATIAAPFIFPVILFVWLEEHGI